MKNLVVFCDKLVNFLGREKARLHMDKITSIDVNDFNILFKEIKLASAVVVNMMWSCLVCVL